MSWAPRASDPTAGYFSHALAVPQFFQITNLGFVLTALAAAVAVGLLRRQWGHASLRSSSDAQRPSASDDGNQPWPCLSRLVAGMIVCVFLTLRMSDPVRPRLLPCREPLGVASAVSADADRHDLRHRQPPRAAARLRSDLALAAIAGLAILQAMVFVLWNSAEELSARRVQVRAIEREVAVESQRKDGFGIDESCRICGCCRGQVRRAARSQRSAGRSVRDDLSGYAARCRFLHPHSALLESALRGVDRWPGDPGLRGPRRRDPHRPRGRTGVATLRFMRPAYVRLSNFVSSAAAAAAVVMLIIAGALRWSRRHESGRDRSS